MSDMNDVINLIFGPLPRSEATVDLTRLPLGKHLKGRGLQAAHFRPVPSLNDVYGPRQATTVVYRRRRSQDHTIEISTAVCGVQDAFNKKVGVALALDRWIEGQRIVLPARQAKMSDYELLQSYFG